MTIAVVVRTIWRVTCAASSGQPPARRRISSDDLGRAQRVLRGSRTASVPISTAADGCARSTRDERDHERPQLLRPGHALVHGQVEPAQQPVAERVQQRVLAAVEMPVERHGRDAELAREPAHAHRLDALGVGQ